MQHTIISERRRFDRFRRRHRVCFVVRHVHALLCRDRVGWRTVGDVAVPQIVA